MGHDRWLVSYADFITLLFGFFVVLYAFARADQKKQVQVSQAIDTAFHAMGVQQDSADSSKTPDETEPNAAAGECRDGRRHPLRRPRWKAIWTACASDLDASTLAARLPRTRSRSRWAAMDW